MELEPNFKIRVTFARRSAHHEDLKDHLQLTWTLRKTPLALKYFKALQIATKIGTMYRQDRCYNFPHCYYTEERIVERLNAAIALINEKHPELIPEQAHVGMTQDQMNHLHTYFEKYRGPLLKPHPIYVKGSHQLREAFDDFNLMIHRYEDAGFSARSTGTGTAKFYLTFGISEKVRRYSLEPEDFQHFTFEQKFGSWIVNYCEVGKPLHDVWRDGDLEIGHEAIVPLRYYSADGVVFLCGDVFPEDARKKRQQFEQWWDQNHDRLSQLGFHKEDPQNAIGHLPVAELDWDHPVLAGRSQAQVIELLSHYQWTSQVECVEI